MKNILLTLCIILTLTATNAAETRKVNKPVTPNPAEFAHILVAHFGGEDKALNEKETIEVLKFLQEHLPENTGSSGFANRLSRENNIGNAARGSMTEERHALREYDAEAYVKEFTGKYDRNDDKVLTRHELTDAMAKVIGIPETKKDWKKRSIAKR